MPEHKKNDKSKAVIAVIGVLALIIAVLFFGPKLWRGNTLNESPETAREEKPALKSSPKITIKNQAPIDYEKNQDLMARRKAELGLDKGVDMIVKPGETIQIGKTLVSMDEILDKIRLKTGAIKEQDLSGQSAIASDHSGIDLPAALNKLGALEKEYIRLKTEVESTPESVDTVTRQRYENLSEKVRTYRQYEDVLQKLDRAKKRLSGADKDQLAVITREINVLNQEKAQLEERILTAIRANQGLNAYGIYVVRPGDNIWNIHFQFLRDYFSHKGVSLSPAADEPGFSGQSSGVGRLLKFSETMVHIYNLREKKIDPDLNLIHPLSKIVIFNLARVFAMLESINFDEVDRIRFDGETLWLPTKNDQ